MEIKGSKELKKWLKTNSLPTAILIHGEDSYQIEKMRDMIIALGSEVMPEFNLYRADGRVAINLQALQDAVFAMPFMAETKVVVVDDINFQTQGTTADGIIELVNAQVEGCTLVVTMTSTDIDTKKKSSKSNKLWEACNKNGIVCKMDKPSRNEICRAATALSVKLGATMETEAANLLAEYCGDDSMRVTNEVQKLCHYTQHITTSEVKLLVEPVIEAKIFDLATSLTDKKLDRALGIISDLIFIREEPVTILTVMSMTFTDIYRAKVAQDCGVIQPDAASGLGYYGSSVFRMKKAWTVANKLNKKQNSAIINALANTDMQMKTTGANTVALLETCVVEIYSIITHSLLV